MKRFRHGGLVFAPLRGWYVVSRGHKKGTRVFAPLRGEPSQSRLTPCQLPRKGELSTGERQLQKLSLRESWRAAPERVLRGEVEVWYKDFDGMAKKFLPPYGDGTHQYLQLREFMTFSPPYGDSTSVLQYGSTILVFSPPYGDGTN